MPSVTKGTLAAGEKLIADGSAYKLAKIDERVKAYDMEDAGFAMACGLARKKWVIFRGVSDLGTPKTKVAGQHSYHEEAAASAMCAADVYIRYLWGERIV